MSAERILFGLCVGLAATVTMDLAASVFRRTGLAAGASGKWVGRWYVGIARGRFAYTNIGDAPEQPGEGRAALVGHYAIGVVLAMAYVVGSSWLGLSPDDLFVALAYGFVTTVFPLLLVYPALGFGL